MRLMIQCLASLASLGTPDVLGRLVGTRTLGSRFHIIQPLEEYGHGNTYGCGVLTR